MSQAQIAQVFNPFSQGDGELSRHYEGTGLGLPVAKAFADAHDAGIEITSEPGTGSTVTLTLAPDRVLFAEPDAVAVGEAG